MTQDQMRAYLVGRYQTSTWAKKVAKMPDDQVQAIYLRLKAARDHRPVRVNGFKAVDTNGRGFYYECPHCFRVFEADNPDLTECRYCGGELSRTPTVEIRKDNQK